MALVPLGTPLYYPPLSGTPVGSPGHSNFAINTIGHRAGVIFIAPVTDTITHIAFRTGSINAGTLEVRVEPMDTATGFPTGALWAANTNATRVMLSTDDNQYFEVALTAPASVTKGDYVCLIVEADTTSIGTIAYGGSANSSVHGYMPLNITFGGSYANQVGSACNIVPKFGTNGYIYMDNFWPCETVTSTTFNNTSTPDVAGNKITVPFSGAVEYVWVDADIDAGAAVSVLASDGSTVLATASLQTNVPGKTAATKTALALSTKITLTAGAVVYLTVTPSSGSNLIFYRYNFESTDMKRVWCANAVAVTAKDPTGSGDYTEIDTSAYSIGLIFSEIDNGITPLTGLHTIEHGVNK
jgi:hypothetical protein